MQVKRIVITLACFVVLFVAYFLPQFRFTTYEFSPDAYDTTNPGVPRHSRIYICFSKIKYNYCGVGESVTELFGVSTLVWIVSVVVTVML